MSPPPAVPRDEVLRRLRTAFRTHGYDGATLSTLSAAAGLTRATLYHHFPEGKERMAAAVLEDLRAWSLAHVLSPLRQEGEPRERLHAMTRGLSDLYTGGEAACLIDVFSVGGPLHQFGDQLKRAMTDLIGGIEDVLLEAGLAAGVARERAEDAVARIQGSLIIARVLGDTSSFKRLMRSLPDQLLTS